MRTLKTQNNRELEEMENTEEPRGCFHGTFLVSWFIRWNDPDLGEPSRPSPTTLTHL